MPTIHDRPVAPVRSAIPAITPTPATAARRTEGFRSTLDRHANGLAAAAGSTASDAASAPPTPPTSATPGAQSETASVEDTLSRTQKFNLYYLELQERVAAEQRRYTALSNVLRAQHETAKNAIGNIR